MRRSASILAALLLLAGAAWPQQADPHAAMSHSGQHDMGFNPAAVTRHFVVSDDGGAVVVEANDPADTATRDAVRAHLGAVAKALTAGDFNSPSFLSDPAAPGVAAIRQFASQINFMYMETERGAKVHLSTDNSEARAAIHQLLEFQIQQHQTQDAVPQSPVKTLTADQVQGLLNAEGMGMAKAAELNHYPGPRHVLQLAAELHLTPEQTAATQQLFDAMHGDALALGQQVIAKEKELDALFASGQPTPQKVSALVNQIAALQGRLRSTHLLTHLKERALLTPEQIAIYDQHRHGEGMHGEHMHQH